MANPHEGCNTGRIRTMHGINHSGGNIELNDGTKGTIESHEHDGMWVLPDGEAFDGFDNMVFVQDANRIEQITH